MSGNPVNLLPQEYSREPFVALLQQQWEQLKNLQTTSLQQMSKNVPEPKKKGIFSRITKKSDPVLDEGLNAATEKKNRIINICGILSANSKTENGQHLNAILVDLLNGSDEKGIVDLTKVLTSAAILQRLTNKDNDLIKAIKLVQSDKSLDPNDKQKYFESLYIVLNNDLDKTNPLFRAALALKGTDELKEKIDILHQQTKSLEEKNVSNKSEENRIIPKNPEQTKKSQKTKKPKKRDEK